MTEVEKGDVVIVAGTTAQVVATAPDKAQVVTTTGLILEVKREAVKPVEIGGYL